MDGLEEIVWCRGFFDRNPEQLPFLKSAVIRAIPLVEALPAIYGMEEMLHALGPYAAGLNAARWDPRFVSKPWPVSRGQLRNSSLRA